VTQRSDDMARRTRSNVGYGGLFLYTVTETQANKLLRFLGTGPLVSIMKLLNFRHLLCHCPAVPSATVRSVQLFATHTNKPFMLIQT
jgi:hypothetical protein